MSGEPPVSPTRDDPVVAGLSPLVGGPVGSRARPGRSWWTPLRVLLALTALTFTLGLVSKQACVGDQWRTDLLTSKDEPDQTRFTHVCDSEVASAWTGSGLVEAVWPWTTDEETTARHTPLAEPALVGEWAWTAARVTLALAGVDPSDRYGTPVDQLEDDPDVRHERVLFVAVNAVGLALLALLATAALVAAHRRRPWDAAAFALSPVLLLAGLASWDLLPAAAAAVALACWARGRPVLAGVAVGVGAAAAVWPVLLLLAAGVPAVGHRRPADLLPPAVTALGTWLVLQLPAFLTGPEVWRTWWRSSVDRTPDRGTVWTVLAQGPGIDTGTVTALSLTLLGLWLAGVLALGLLAPRTPRVSQLAFLMLAGVVLLRASYDAPQALWLLPLAALARPRWRDQLVWQGAEVLHLAAQSWWLGGVLDPGGNGSAGFYWIAVAVHVLATLYLVALVARDVWLPWHDPAAVERTALEAGWGQETSTRSTSVAV